MLCLRYNDLKVLEMRVEEMRLALASIPARLKTAGKLTPRRVTASVGVCLDEARQGFAETLAKADEALFAAKKNRTRPCGFFSRISRAGLRPVGPANIQFIPPKNLRQAKCSSATSG